MRAVPASWLDAHRLSRLDLEEPARRARAGKVTPTRVGRGIDAETVGRFCFINPDTTEADIQAILDTLA
ncbi:MAG: hypothetical protein U0P30_01675 [Vicinamibacterales bacterium]